MVRIGNPAPPFETEAYVPGEGDPQRIALERYRGSWVVLFLYPRDFTFVCPTELQAFAELEAGFAAEEAVLVAASTDSYWSHKAWFESHPMLAVVGYPVLADTTHALAAAYGVLLEDGSALRATFRRPRRNRPPRVDQRSERRAKPGRDPARAAGAPNRCSLPGRLAQGTAYAEDRLRRGGEEMRSSKQSKVREVVVRRPSRVPRRRGPRPSRFES